jgi:ketosteroid isomerase-like protein
MSLHAQEALMTTADGVLDLVERWAAAEQQNDADLLGGLLADDFVGVGPFGFVLTREQWLARFRNGLVNRSFTIEDPQVRGYGTAAVVVAALAQEMSWQGDDNSGRYRITLVTARSPESWRLASVHIGPLQIPPGRPASS